MMIAESTVYNMIKRDFQYEDKGPRELLLDGDDRIAITEAAKEDRDMTAADIARHE